ncbi:hypothetical protein FNV43_RR20894 [Rhamnella rubrinervis]|uniref:Uncharacterized protein n=1 Tax=Rhamnella rubrinervis TaxID=2594499 RepID=A0A8K0E174_9ROSA|nr:hypothetical protein FNV43_RR20894 [Rhamnella rubrinervis]
MGGGAWPLLVGGAICPVNSANLTTSPLLSYAEVTLRRQLLEGLWPLRPRKFEAQCIIAIVGLQRGIPSKRSHHSLTTPPPFVHTAAALPIEWSVKCSIGRRAVRRRDATRSPSTLSFRGRRSRIRFREVNPRRIIVETPHAVTHPRNP